MQLTTSVNAKMLEWMLAKKSNILTVGHNGGLIFDEMKIQEDLQISQQGGLQTLVGLTKNNDNVKLADHVQSCHVP